jgi:ribonuclease P protein component
VDQPAVGYAIGKKSGGSVVRNRIRRRLRAAVASANMPLTSGFYLISADATAATLPFSDLTNAVRSAFASLSNEAQR